MKKENKQKISLNIEEFEKLINDIVDKKLNEKIVQAEGRVFTKLRADLSRLAWRLSSLELVLYGNLKSVSPKPEIVNEVMMQEDILAANVEVMFNRMQEIKKQREEELKLQREQEAEKNKLNTEDKK